jgi:hypothetical protein
VKEVFWLNETERDTLLKERGIQSTTETTNTPYENTMQFLQCVFWEQSPMAKLELIYNALALKLPEDVDNFWEGCDRFKSVKERTIDIDNL